MPKNADNARLTPTSTASHGRFRRNATASTIADTPAPKRMPRGSMCRAGVGVSRDIWGVSGREERGSEDGIGARSKTASTTSVRGPEKEVRWRPRQAAACSTLAGTRRRQEHCRPIQPTRATSLTGGSVAGGSRGSSGTFRCRRPSRTLRSTRRRSTVRVTVTPDQVRSAFEAVKDDPSFDESRGLWERGRPPVEMLQAMCLRPEILRAFGGLRRWRLSGRPPGAARQGARDHHGVARQRVPVLHERARRHGRHRRHRG